MLRLVFNGRPRRRGCTSTPARAEILDGGDGGVCCTELRDEGFDATKSPARAAPGGPGSARRADAMPGRHTAYDREPMSSDLVPCPRCHRHVHEQERACPFCGERASFAAIARIAFAAVLVAACDRTTGEVYGAPRPPPPDANITAAADAQGKADAGTRRVPGDPLDPSPVPAYGAPPPSPSR
jgi:hypothetical protein